MNTRMVCVVVALFGLTACSESTPNDAATEAAPLAAEATLDACGLLTAQDIVDVMGWSPGTPDGRPGTQLSQCRWTEPGDGLRFVDLLISTAGTSTYEELEARMRETGAETIGPIERVDVGDFAGWGGTPQFGMLQTVRRGRLVNVSARGAADGNARDASVAIAGRAAPRVR